MMPRLVYPLPEEVGAGLPGIIQNDEVSDTTGDAIYTKAGTKYRYPSNSKK